LSEAITLFDLNPSGGEWLSEIKEYSQEELNLLELLAGYIAQYFDKSDETVSVYQDLH